jgi:hypothetical protein
MICMSTYTPRGYEKLWAFALHVFTILKFRHALKFVLIQPPLATEQSRRYPAVLVPQHAGSPHCAAEQVYLGLYC